MHEVAQSILYTPYWEAFNAIALLAGLGSIVALLLGMVRTTRQKVLMWTGLGLLFLSIVFSMVFEEILPVLPGLPEHRRLPYVLSFPGFLIFVIMFILGGRRLVRDIFVALPDLFRRKAGQSQGGETVSLFKAMRPGLLWLGAAVLIFLVSLIGYHGPQTTLGWLVWNE